MRVFQAFVTSIFLTIVAHAPARADSVIAIAVPLGAYPALAAQIVDGVKAHLATRQGMTATVFDMPCEADAAAEAADALAESAPAAVIGLPCIESLEAVAARFGGRPVPLVTVGGRAPYANDGVTLARTGPREVAEPEATARLLLGAWAGLPFGILDDGSVEARIAAETLRAAAEDSGNAPRFMREFRPQQATQAALVAAIRDDGALRVFIAGDVEDIAMITREASAQGVLLEVAAGSRLELGDASSWPQGTLMVARDTIVPDTVLTAITAARSEPFAVAEGLAPDAWLAAEIAAILITDPDAAQFQTSAGLLARADDGFLDPVPFALFRHDGTGFQKVSP
jgi:branched-chain amino acid transport system substrate-binding protein